MDTRCTKRINQNSSSSQNYYSPINIAASIHPTQSIKKLVEKKRRRERRVRRQKTLNSGWKSNLLNILGLLSSLTMFAVHSIHLQLDADHKFFQPEIYLHEYIHRELLPNIVKNGHWIAIASLIIHMISLVFSRTRVNFSSLLVIFTWALIAFLHFEMNHRPDYLLCRLIASTLTAISFLLIVFIPKKLKHRKKGNSICSAFSTTSTPESRLSSNIYGSVAEDDSRTILSSLDDDDRTSVLSFRTTYSTRSNKTLASAASKRAILPLKPKDPWCLRSFSKKDPIDDTIAELDSLNGSGSIRSFQPKAKETIEKKASIAQLLTNKLTLYSTEESSDEDVLKNLDLFRNGKKKTSSSSTPLQKTQWRRNIDHMDW